MGGPDWSVAEVAHFDWASPGRAGSADVHHLPDTEAQHRGHIGHMVHYGIDAVHMAEVIEIWYHALHGLGHGGHAVSVGAGLAWPQVAGVTALEATGGVLTGVVVFWELYRSFTIGQRIQHQQGLAYGLMWEVLGVKDVERTTKGSAFDPSGAHDIPLEESEKEAWREGIEEGRALADKKVTIGGRIELVDGFPKRVGGQEVTVRELVTATVAYEMAQQGKDPLTDPHQKAWNTAVNNTLNRVWYEVRETSKVWGETSLNQHDLSWMGNDNGFPQPPAPRQP
jgi:hypothetical protein